MFEVSGSTSLKIDQHIFYTYKHDLKRLSLCLLANNISPNAAKTELIIVRKPGYKTPPSFKVCINGQRLYPSHNIKYLRIYLDELLKGIAHVENLQPKVNRADGMLSKIRHFF